MPRGHFSRGPYKIDHSISNCIINLMQDGKKRGCRQIADELGLSTSQIQLRTYRLVEENKLVPLGPQRQRVYRIGEAG